MAYAAKGTTHGTQSPFFYAAAQRMQAARTGEHGGAIV